MLIYYRKSLIDKTGASLNLWRSISLLLMIVVIWIAFAGASYGAIIINAQMTNTSSSGWTLGGTPNSSLLTGNGTIDPVGSGWLRLTDNEGNQTGFAYNDTSFNLSQGLLIQFDYSTWGGTGADGYSVYLFDAGVSTFNIGAFGGSLGYAQKLPPTVTPAVPGISGGYVGIGVDEYGNFANPTEGRYLGPGAEPNTVTIRGSVDDFGGGAIGGTTDTDSYPWIATSANYGSLWYNGTPRPSQTSTNYRKVVIEIGSVSCPSSSPLVNVWIQFGYNQPLTQMITNATLPSISCSQSLMIGYAASTGGSTDYHEIRNLLVTGLNTSTSIDLGITKTASVTTATIGSPITYTVTARNNGPNNITATGVGITDTIPAGININTVTWACLVVSGSPSGTSCGAASGSGNLSTTANLPYGGAVTYTITGTVSGPAPAQLSNTASLVIPGSINDFNPNDQSATVTVPVNNLSTSTKTVTDLTSSNYAPGDTLQYTITLNENGGLATSGISVADTIDTTNLTGQTITSCPSGATCSYSAGALSVTGISIPANGSVTIVYTATIVSTDTPGTAINNTATVTNPNGAVVTLVAPAVTVGGASAGTGTKQLYLYDGTSTPAWKLSRTKNTTSANTVTLVYSTGSQTWSMNPVDAAITTISSAVSATVPVTLYLARNGTTGNRSVEVDLQCSSGGTILTQTQTITTLTTTATAYSFALPLAGTVSCAQGNYWNLTVKNKTTNNGYSLIVYPQYNTNPSHVDLPATTVINVNSIGFYNATYPGTAIISVPAGSTVYIQAVVSDPFGSYDIVNVPTITISNPSGTAMVSAAAMTLVATGTQTPSLTETFQYKYVVPASPAGNWSISVTAMEGTEGTVSDMGYASMPVTLPALLTILKSASPSPISPGQVLTYTITITNTGTGTATNATAIDSVPAYTTYVANSTTLNGITVAGDGTTSPLIAGLRVDNNSGRTAGAAATGILPAGGVAIIVYQVKVN